MNLMGAKGLLNETLGDSDGVFPFVRNPFVRTAFIRTAFVRKSFVRIAIC
jgi:hypothetical protein